MGRHRQYDPNAAYDDEGYLLLTTVICAPENGNSWVLLVSDKSGTKWKLPGGACNWNENADDAALRELSEEAGVYGEIRRFLGTFQNGERKRRTHVFVVSYTAHGLYWEENSRYGRQRSWFSFDVARKWLLQYYVEQVVYLDRFWLKEVRRPFLQRCECAITTDQSIRDAADHDAET